MRKDPRAAEELVMGIGGGSRRRKASIKQVISWRRRVLPEIRGVNLSVYGKGRFGGELILRYTSGVISTLPQNGGPMVPNPRCCIVCQHFDMVFSINPLRLFQKIDPLQFEKAPCKAFRPLSSRSEFLKPET